MPKRLKKLSEEILHKNPWYEYKHDRYTLPNGGEGDYFYIETNGTSIVIPFLEDGRVLLTVQYRYLHDKQSIEFPAGGIKEGQDPLVAAKAELYEETGWVAKDFVKVATLEPSTGCIKDKTHVYVAHVVEEHEQHLDETEDIELVYRKVSEVEDMIRRNDIWDGMSLAAWALARHHMYNNRLM
ncbi:NUDIX hydrolase [Patescibacteria group bacterium]|nr:NUDIX hydrolase [Patescibacteria group bacterium]MBU1721725.1 NUDIX hydrolase [Patescibacteria group bacterium]MBU1901437.1 NUDIX hydrolase [Patescibacteria group bacterium]